MNILHKLWNILSAVLIFFGFIFFVISLIGIKPYIVASGSMEPAIHTGSLVFSANRKVQPEIGDVITYQKDEAFVTHRIVRIEENGYITKGDANDQEDFFTVSPSQVVGKVLFSVPFFGYLFSILQSSKALFCILAIAILSILCDFSASFYNSNKNSRTKGEGAKGLPVNHHEKSFQQKTIKKRDSGHFVHRCFGNWRFHGLSDRL